MAYKGWEMPEVKVKFVSLIRDYTGVKETTINIPKGAKLKDLISILEERFPGLKKIKEKRINIIVLADGQTVHEDSQDISVYKKIVLLPPASGG